MTCSLTAISSSCHLLPSAWWSLCSQCSCLSECAVQCTCLWGNLLSPLWPRRRSYSDMMEMCSNSLVCLPPRTPRPPRPPPCLLMALDLFLHSGKWRTASLCVPIAFWESTCIGAGWPNEPLWLILVLLWGFEFAWEAFCILAPREPKPKAKEFARSFWFDFIFLWEMDDQSRFEVKVYLRQTTVYCDS